jgi:hypothetical protein
MFAAGNGEAAMTLRTLGSVFTLSLSLLVACSGEVAPAQTEEGDAPGDVTLAPGATLQAAATWTVADAMDRARSGVGFSYFWGGGCWNPDASAKGSCSGSCPSCSHSGTWGADCSGYVAKVWQVPRSVATTTCSHPYSTDNFYNEEREWKTIPRGQARRGDALVYRKNGAGHIFIFDSGDPWGSMKAYEAKGCSYGIVVNSRTASSDYKAIRRTGF